MKTFAKSVMLAAAVHLTVIAAPALAFAQAAQSQPAPAAAVAARPAAGGTDVIDLKDGGILRGTIIDAIPNGHARIQLATGEIATVPWQDISKIERGAAPAPTPGTPAPTAAPTPAPAPAEAQMVWVHVDGADNARLEQDRTGDGHVWEAICTAPCDKALPNAYAYRVTGDGIRDSAPFTLSGAANTRETLNVNEGSKGGFVLGIVSTAIGGGVLVIGLFVVLIAAASRSIDTTDGVSTSSDSNAETVGWIMSAAGGAGIVGGILLIVSNARTRVSQDGPPAPSTGSGNSDATTPQWARIPGLNDGFNDSRRRDVLTGSIPAALTVPIFGGHF
jgi:hypothetical protein